MGVEDHREPGPHGPAATILSESRLSCLRSERRGARGDPQSEGAAVPVQAVSADVRRDGRDGTVPAADGTGYDRDGGDAAGVRLPGPGDRGGVRTGRADRRALADAGRSAVSARPRAPGPGRAGRPGAGPGRRAAGAGGRRHPLAGVGYRAAEPSLARRRREPVARCAADPDRARAYLGLWDEAGPPALYGWSAQLPEAGAASVPGPRTDRPA